MNHRLHTWPCALTALTLVCGALACSSAGSQFEPPPSNGGSGTTTGGGSSTGGASTGGASGGTTGGTGMTSGGTSGASTSGGTGGATGGSAGSAGSGGTIDAGPVCPKPEGEICHEFIANDNARNRVNYVNEFTCTKPDCIEWYTDLGITGLNSPRSIEIVDNAAAKAGKAVLVSVHNGYRELDLVDGTVLANPTTNTVTAPTSDIANGVSGANRLPDGTTALGVKDKIRIIGATGALVREFSLPTGDNLRALTRNPDTGNFWFTKTQLIYEVNDQGTVAWDGDMGAGTKGYLVWWRDGGGAYATTGEPATVLEVDATGQIVNTVGGRDAFPYLDFFSGFVRLANGNFVVAHWLGHLTAPEDDIPHAVEFTPANELVWQWGNQTAARQITNVFVLR
jgi:hypothetical protein